jgi:hypothetical protein
LHPLDDARRKQLLVQVTCGPSHVTGCNDAAHLYADAAGVYEGVVEVLEGCCCIVHAAVPNKGHLPRLAIPVAGGVKQQHPGMQWSDEGVHAACCACVLPSLPATPPQTSTGACSSGCAPGFQYLDVRDLSLDCKVVLEPLLRQVLGDVFDTQPGGGGLRVCCQAGGLLPSMQLRRAGVLLLLLVRLLFVSSWLGCCHVCAVSVAVGVTTAAAAAAAAAAAVVTAAGLLCS